MFQNLECLRQNEQLHLPLSLHGVLQAEAVASHSDHVLGSRICLAQTLAEDVLSALLGELNASNDFSLFVRSMRKQFKLMAAIVCWQ